MILNEHTLAIEISKREGKKESINIAQIKEVLNITLSILKEELNNNGPDHLLDFIKNSK